MRPLRPLRPLRPPRPLHHRAPPALAAALVLAALLALPPAAPAAIQKCQGPQGTTYSDGDCPANTTATKFVPRKPGASGPAAAAAETPPPPAPGPAGARPPDDPLPLIDTGLPVLRQVPGRYAWLDDDTLAVTTYADEKAKVPWMIRRIVAFDLRSRSATTLVARGFLDCVNPEAGLVGLELGDLSGRFAVGSTAPPPQQQFRQWDRQARALAPAAADAATAWHPLACVKTTPQDLQSTEWWDGRKPLRYLQPGHGAIRWGSIDGGRPEGPAIYNGPKKTVLDLSSNDIARQLRWQPFQRSYLIHAGVHDGAAQPALELPMITMSPDGRLTRTPLPPTLTRPLDALGRGVRAEMIAVRPGGLTQVDAPPAQGGGLYLSQGVQSRRIWCTGAGADCHIGLAIEVSPDGCRIAFDAKPPGAAAGLAADGTVQVLTLCTPPDAARAKRR